jgi:hypothetical protein
MQAPATRDLTKPLPSLTPVAQFDVDAGRYRKQRFACLPDNRGGVQLNVATSRGFRSVRQWPFPTPAEARRWAEQAMLCSGRFNVL